jgi:hypothetical protein
VQAALRGYAACRTSGTLFVSRKQFVHAAIRAGRTITCAGIAADIAIAWGCEVFVGKVGMVIERSWR